MNHSRLHFVSQAVIKNTFWLNKQVTTAIRACRTTTTREKKVFDDNTRTANETDKDPVVPFNCVSLPLFAFALINIFFLCRCDLDKIFGSVVKGQIKVYVLADNIVNNMTNISRE
jgi:hypothetical protein